jgi:hypothetical protein
VGRGKGAGTGSPVFFFCWASRQVGDSKQGHVVNLTGRERPYHRKRYSAKGSRSSDVSREYVCSCGHIGWSNHIDLDPSRR